MDRYKRTIENLRVDFITMRTRRKRKTWIRKKYKKEYEMGKVKYITDERKVRFCTTCRKIHSITDDGFEYSDCMLYMKKRDGKKKSG